jgi:capsular exopolysaccharide synthesis family protein
LFGLGNDVGLTSVILGQVPLNSAVVPVPGQPRLMLLTSGPPPPNPAEILGSGRTADIIDALRAEFDVVLLDCPPVLPVTDALLSAAHADATVIVCRAGHTTRNGVSRTIELLSRVEAPLVGIVLNGVASDELAEARA